jgi:hypothetical protein
LGTAARRGVSVPGAGRREIEELWRNSQQKGQEYQSDKRAKAAAMCHNSACQWETIAVPPALSETENGMSS